MNSFFLLNMNFLFEQKFMFKISFFFYRNLFILTILKGLKPFYLQGKTWNWIKKLFSLWFFSGYCMIHDNVGGIRDPLKQDIVLEICREKKQSHYYFNWNSLFGLHLFSLLEIVTQKDCLFFFIQVLKVSLRLTLIQKGVCVL